MSSRPLAAPEGLRKSAPFATALRDIQNRVDEDNVRNPHVPALNRKIGVDSGLLFRRDLLHDCASPNFYPTVDKHLSTEPSKILVSTGPSSSQAKR